MSGIVTFLSGPEHAKRVLNPFFGSGRRHFIGKGGAIPFERGEPSEACDPSDGVARGFRWLLTSGQFKRDTWQHLEISGQEFLEARPVFSPIKVKIMVRSFHMRNF